MENPNDIIADDMREYAAEREQEEFEIGLERT